MKSFLFVLLTFCYFFAKGQNVNVTFQVNMSAEIISANGVHIAGNFQMPAGLGANWTPGSTLMNDSNGDAVYELTVSLPSGTYEYKYINGNAWGSDEIPPAECSIGNNHNREITVGDADLILAPVPFNGCISKMRLAVNMTGQVVSSQGLHVMGDFQQAAGLPQNWDASSILLKDQNGDGTYEAEFQLPFGDYQFLFVNGNTILDAESLPVDCTILGNNGSRTRTFTFSATDKSPVVYCFNSCNACHPSVIYEYDTHWWNDAVFYEIFVRSFYDSNGNGIGDFRGLIEKLDYLNDGNPDTHDDLEITGIWLMPMMPSPSYHGYDITDYYGTESDYGTMADFEAFLTAAHQRGIKVIIDLVMNHNSSQSSWFTQSASSTADFRNWYRWSDTNPGYLGPWGQTVWHNRNGKFYYGLFGSGLPDLNYAYPPVKDAMFNVVNFWLDKGVDGYRLDAIKYLIEDGQLLENTNETYSLLQEFHDLYKAKNPEAFTVGEVWSSTESIIPYVHDGRLDACFEFGLAGAILEAVDNSNPPALEEQLEAVLDAYPALQYGTFLTNHDIDRVFSGLGSNVEKMKLAASLYMTLPGVPFVYYGEELGMLGTGDDVNKRRPMQWSDGAGAGFSTVNPWTNPGTNYQVNNVEELAADPNSLLWHYRHLIRIRNEQEALRRGQTIEIDDNVAGAFSFARVLKDEAVIVVANTATQSIEPFLTLDQSGLISGEYFVTELMSHQAMGKVVIDDNGGFANWKANILTLAGRSSWILSITLENPVTAVSEPTFRGHIKVTPNPTSDSFEITRDQEASGNAKLQIYTSSGNLFFERKMEGNKTTVKTIGWPAGIYVVQISDEKGTMTERVMVTVE
ncbi:MAG TPA: alpha-amylase family glycosyl hydrolase [Saprospiraceae bacterium]|nr:alpha-amylase family glycosyl hydrolase [Saprospiraceae bacterium]